MNTKYFLSPDRVLTESEKKLIWQKPESHIESDAEIRICNEVKRNWKSAEMKIANILLEGDAGSGKTEIAKALSASFGLPYTKITCFADMDKSDVIGSILPVTSLDSECAKNKAEYQFYPSEIVRAFQNGWILEIQEPTVIRDAAVLMALNSALEPDGIINLPHEILHRHPDFIAVITTNRGYNGCRPLNEALRDRIQHAEKIDTPEVAEMVRRAVSKTGCRDEHILTLFAETISILDKTAKSNAIKGVAGMRSYFYWIDAASSGCDAKESMYHKVIYKITTDEYEIGILEKALEEHGIFAKLENVNCSSQNVKKTNGLTMEIHTEGVLDFSESEDNRQDDNIPAVALIKSDDSENNDFFNSESEESLKTKITDTDDIGNPMYHKAEHEFQSYDEKKKSFRKKLNRDARSSVKGSVHDKIKLIIHRPESTESHRDEYHKIHTELVQVIEEMVRKTKPLLENEISSEFSGSRLYGTKFRADKLSGQDFRYFSKKNPPDENPSLAVVLRIDESVSMKADLKIEAAKYAAVAVYEFCRILDIPIAIYGDTADVSRLEQMAMYSYIDFDDDSLDDKYCIMNITGRSNNRDGMALRILSDKLLTLPHSTKLLISISDGKPNALPDYYGESAAADMKDVISEYSGKGILFLSAAIGTDKDIIENIYGGDRFIDISNLRTLPSRLVSVIARYI